MAEEQEAAYGSEEPGDRPVFPETAGTGPSDWNDLGSDPQWPEAWPSPTSGPAAPAGDPTVPFGSGPDDAGRAGLWTAAPPSAPDDTWHDDTWRGTTWAGAGGEAAPPNKGRRRRPSWGPAALVATVLVAGGAGAGIALAVSNNGGSASPKSTALPPRAHNAAPLVQCTGTERPFDCLPRRPRHGGHYRQRGERSGRRNGHDHHGFGGRPHQ